MKILSTEEVSPNVYRVVTESEKYGVVSQTVLMMPEVNMQKCPDCKGRGGLSKADGWGVVSCDRCNHTGMVADAKDLREYIRNNPCKGFKPIPYTSESGNCIHWYWKDEHCYAEPLYHDDKWIGTVYRSFKTKEVVGVKIHLEAIK